MLDYFFTIASRGEGLYKEKGSKFIGIALPVQSEEEVDNHLQNIRKEYHDARHHCYAWILGENSERSRANDDGEPGHSAGDPILGQIKSLELTHTLVVVVRYFGGTKLGVSGLIHAYKSAAAEALAQTKVVKVPILEYFELEYGYDQTSQVMRFIHDENLKIIEQQFEQTCKMKVSSPRSRAPEVTKSLQNLRERAIVNYYLHIES